MSLGERLLELRKSKHLSQEELAYKLDVTRQTISKWETDQSTPDFDKIMPLCELYGITSDELLTGAFKEKVKEESKNNKGKKLGLVISIFLFFLAIAWVVLADEFSVPDGINVPIFLLIIAFGDQKQFDNIEKNIESYQSRIAQLSEILAEISLPYKKQFDECYARTQKHEEDRIKKDEFVNNIEGMIKGAFGQQEIYWDKIFKLIIYFCIFTQLFTSFTKPDFISLVTEIALAIIVSTKMTNYLFDYYKIFFFGIIIGICYDLFDFLFVSNIEISSMSSVNSIVRIFGFLGFLGKLALLITIIVIKQKNGNAVNPSPEINNN